MNIATTLTKVSRVKGAFRIWPAFYNFGLNSPLVVSTSTWQTRTTMEFLASSPTRTNHCQSFFIPESRNDIVHSNDQFSLVTSTLIMSNIIWQKQWLCSTGFLKLMIHRSGYDLKPDSNDHIIPWSYFRWPSRFYGNKNSILKSCLGRAEVRKWICLTFSRQERLSIAKVG